MLGERYTTAELLACGAAFRVVPDGGGKAEAMALARRLGAAPAAALHRMKRVLALTTASDLDRALALETDATVAGFLD